MSGQGSTQYAAIANVPLLRAPTLRVPKPVEMPQDIHPLPDDIQAYFRYPFTLEPHVLTLESSRQATLAAHASRREACLRAREDEKERRKKEILRRVAPGFEPSKGVLLPTSLHPAREADTGPGGLKNKDAMEALVDHLAALDSASGRS